jgi:preprotein translocase subunit SecG
MITSLGLWLLSERGVKSVVRGEGSPSKEATAVTETVKEESKEENKGATTEQKQGTTEQKKENKGTGTEKK